MAKARVSFSSSQARSSLNPARKGSQVRALYRSCTHARPAGELMYQFVNPRGPNRKTALEYRRLGRFGGNLYRPPISFPFLRHGDHPYGTRHPSHAVIPDPDQRRNPGSDTMHTAVCVWLLIRNQTHTARRNGGPRDLGRDLGRNQPNMPLKRDRPPRDMPCRTRPLSCVLSTPQSRSAHWYRGPR